MSLIKMCIFYELFSYSLLLCIYYDKIVKEKYKNITLEENYMNILQIAILAFIIIESLNVLMLYFSPGMKRGNALGVFNAWEKSQENEEMKSFVSYLSSWVAGAKLIFIMIGIVIIIWGNFETQIATTVALIISIASFFFKLYPIIKKMDAKGQISPKGYSKTLLYMIIGFIAVFIVVLVIALVQYL